MLPFQFLNDIWQPDNFTNSTLLPQPSTCYTFYRVPPVPSSLSREVDPHLIRVRNPLRPFQSTHALLFSHSWSRSSPRPSTTFPIHFGSNSALIAKSSRFPLEILSFSSSFLTCVSLDSPRHFERGSRGEVLSLSVFAPRKEVMSFAGRSASSRRIGTLIGQPTGTERR